MEAAAALVEEASQQYADADGIVRLHDVSWDDYLTLLRIRGDRSAPRISYLDGEVEIMSPSRSHETIKSMIGRLVEAYCLEREIPFRPIGSWTLKSKPKRRGAEPDECYIFGAADADRPHLAIEVIWTSGRLDKLEIYRKLGVAEVWVWRRNQIQPYVLHGSGYEPAEQSTVLPGLDLVLLASFLDRPTAFDAIRGFQAALRGDGGSM